MQSEKLRPYFIVVLLIGGVALVGVIFAPFLKPLALAAVFAVVLRGLYTRIARLMGNRLPSVAALLTVVIATILILLPLTIIGILVGNEARGVYVSLESNGRGSLTEFAQQIDVRFGTMVPGLSEFAQNLSANIDLYTSQVLRWVVNNASQIFSGLSSVALSFFIFFIALYYLLRDGARLREAFIKLSPLSEKEDSKVFERLELAVNSVIKGNLTVALIQGVLTAIGFTIFGVPNGVLWGSLAAFAALIPGVGTSLVLAPAIAFLFLTGAFAQAIGLLAWGMLAVGLIDNLLGPKLVGRGMRLHPLLVLLSVLGGLMFFGPSGVFLGPLSLSLLFAVLSVYSDSSSA